MKRFYTIVLTLLAIGMVSQSQAQQDALYSQYMFNPFVINPGYAGSRESLSAVLLSRSQWLGIDGAPRTQTLSVHSPIARRKMALGLNISNDQIGPTRTTGASATYAYHLKFSKGKLSLALRGGIYSSMLDHSLLDYQDPSDRFNQQGTVSATAPSFDFGAYYFTQRFYAGLAVTHLTQEEFGYDGAAASMNSGANSGDNSGLDRHIMLMSGYAFSLNDNVVFKPSMLVKYVAAAPVNVDVNASFLFRKVFWLGASYRSGNGFVLMTEYNVTDFLRLGYSYDIVTNALQSYNRGSHEIFIGADFAIGKQKTVDPRYL